MNKRVLRVLGIVTFIGTVYTIANAMSVVRTEYTVHTHKVKDTYKIVFISDIHYGCVQPKYVPERALERVKSECADVVILGGDIVQSPVTSKADMERIFKILGSLNTKDGVYFVYGNHDAVDDGTAFDSPSHTDFYTQNELVNVLQENGISVLQDSTVFLTDNICLIGRDNGLCYDSKRKPISQLLKHTEDFTICVDHTPVEQNECSTCGIDLLLSGHTHGGQLFPINLIQETVWNMPSYGYKEFSGMATIVSSGMGVGACNLRNMHHCEYVVINVVPR